MNQLEALKKYTTVVADSGDIEAIRQFQPQDATTNPSLVLKAAQLTQYQSLVTDAIGKACSQGNQEIQLANACDQVAVDIGTEVLRHVQGVFRLKSMPVLLLTAACVYRRHGKSFGCMKERCWAGANSNKAGRHLGGHSCCGRAGAKRY